MKAEVASGIRCGDLRSTTSDGSRAQSSKYGTVKKGELFQITKTDALDAFFKNNKSLFSRLSGGSAQSDVLPNEKKKKKSIFGKLKKLTKSRSIDDQADPEIVDFRPIGTVSQVNKYIPS